MPRVPKTGEDPLDFSRFTFDLWRGLDGKYEFWVQKWKRTLDFLRDAHWNALKEFDRTVLPDWKKYPLQNYTLAFYNDYLTDYLKSEVRFSALPASADPHDIDAAELAEQVLKYLWDRLNFGKKRIDLAAWLIAAGTAHLRIFWDTDTGEQVPLGIPTPDGGFIPVDLETMAPKVGEPDIVDAGEIGVEVVSPQFVRWAENPAHGVMVGLLLSYEEAVTFYGEDVAEKLEYTAEHAGISSELRRIERPGKRAANDERTLVIEHYLPKSFRHPEGLWWTAAQGGHMMIHEPWPLPAGRIPIISFRWIPMPGEEHIGLSPMYGITFQNKIYEEIMGKLLEWYQKAKPKRLLISGGGISKGDITDEPYQELMVNQGGEPQNLDVDDAPPGLFRLLQQTQNDMSITSGRTFEEADQLPEGLATTRIRAPAEMKQSKAVTTAHISGKPSWQEVGEVLLHYVAEFYDEGRVVAVQGPDKAFLWREFSGEDITGESGLAATINVDDIPLFPQNRQNLRDTVIALLQTEAGQILFAGPTGQLDMDRINAALKATGLDADLDMVDPDVLEARNEQITFQNLKPGEQPPQVQPWQEHSTHYAEHVKVVKSIRFKSWPEENRQLYLQHLQQTEQQLNAQAEQEAEAMVEQERKLRHVREQEELRADVMKKWAESMIELVAETTGISVQDLMGLIERPQQEVMNEAASEARGSGSSGEASE